MKKTSRLRPKISKEHPKLSWFLFIIIIGLFAILLILFFYELSILIWQFPVTLLLILFLGFLIYRDNKRTEHKFNKILQQRNNESISTFTRSFNCKEVDPLIIRVVYEQLQTNLDKPYRNLPINVDDDIFHDLEIDQEDFDLDIIEEIVKQTGRSIENYENNPHYNRINTVYGLVMFFNSQPKINKTNQ